MDQTEVFLARARNARLLANHLSNLGLPLIRPQRQLSPIYLDSINQLIQRILFLALSLLPYALLVADRPSATSCRIRTSSL